MANENIKEFVITRTFNAPLSLVWDAHTKAEHMSKWWGPKGFKMLKCTLDLRPGGVFHYGMVPIAIGAPDGHTMWGKFVYREVVPKTKLVFVVSFSDEKQGFTRHPMAPNWPLEVLNTMILEEKNGKTIMTMKGHPINASEEENKMFYSAFEGMNQGFKGTFDQLDEYLLILK